MKKRLILHTLTPFLLASYISTTQSEAVSYSFDGTLSDHFSNFSTQAGVVFDESGAGTLTYHNNNTDVGLESTSTKHSLNFEPLYSQSWDASIKVSIPTNYVGIGGDPFIDMAFTAAGGSTIYAISLAEDGGRTVFAQSQLAENDVPTSSEMVTLRLSFDSATKILTGSADGLGIALAVDTDDPATDWGMTESSAFTIGLNATHASVNIPSSNAAFFDDFNASVVPEPSSTALFSLAALALMLRRKRGIRLP